jgi:single-strand DNA-binding protein
MFAQVTIVGNLGKDAEMRYTPGGKPVTSFSVAVSEKRGDNEETTWWRVSCWDRLAEVAGQYLTKGSKVLVVGNRIKVRTYVDKGVETKASLEVTAIDIKFLSTKGEQTGSVEPETLDDVGAAIPF